MLFGHDMINTIGRGTGPWLKHSILQVPRTDLIGCKSNMGGCSSASSMAVIPTAQRSHSWLYPPFLSTAATSGAILKETVQKEKTVYYILVFLFPPDTWNHHCVSWGLLRPWHLKNRYAVLKMACISQDQDISWDGNIS